MSDTYMQDEAGRAAEETPESAAGKSVPEGPAAPQTPGSSVSQSAPQASGLSASPSAPQTPGSSASQSAPQDSGLSASPSAPQTSGSSVSPAASQNPGTLGSGRAQTGTYSWVNPRIRQDIPENRQGANPWGSGEEGRFWQTADPRGQQSFSRNQQGSYVSQNPWDAGRSGNRGQEYRQEPKDKSRQNFADHSRRPGIPEPSEPGGSGENRPSGGRRWRTVIAMALVFGLIAGSMTYAVNLIGNRIYPAVPPQAAADDSGSSQAQRPQLGKTGTSQDQIPQNEIPESGIPEQPDTSAAPAPPAQSAAGSGMTVAEVTANTMPALVTISTMSVMEMQSFFGGSQKYTAQGAGTGIIVGQNDTELLIATNNHVVESATQLSVGFIDEEAAEAAVKGTDTETDLAIIAVRLEDIPDETMEQIKIATLGDSDELVLGEQIVVIGNALGYGQSVTSGYVSAFDRELSLTDGRNSFTSSNLIQVDAAINSGNSGGALLNMRGELVGINEAKSSMTSSGATVDNVGYAIPINKAEPILNELMNETTRQRYSEDEQGYLGVTCANVTSEYAQMYGLPEGVCFTSVAEDGPAGEAGIQKGDVLTTLDGKAVKTYAQLMERLTYYKAGETVDVVILRADNGEYKEHNMTVTLGSKDVLEKVTGQTAEDD